VKCPTCPTATLVMTERSGIEIDYCPDCRGVWLDRGELDKLIERSIPDQAPSRLLSAREGSAPTPPRSPRRDWDDDDDHRGDSSDGRNGKRRKKGLLSELFDF